MTAVRRCLAACGTSSTECMFRSLPLQNACTLRCRVGGCVYGIGTASIKPDVRRVPPPLFAARVVRALNGADDVGATVNRLELPWLGAPGEPSGGRMPRAEERSLRQV